MSLIAVQKLLLDAEASRLFNALLSLALTRHKLGTAEAGNTIGAAVDLSAVNNRQSRGEIRQVASQSFQGLDTAGKSWGAYQLLEGLHRRLPDDVQQLLKDLRCAVVNGELIFAGLDRQ